MSFSNSEELFKHFNSLKVLVIGDVMVDSYVWGNIERVSPEAPVPVVRVHKKESRLGGAANVALNVQAMGATPLLCSIIGDDLEGKLFLKRMDIRGLSSEGIVISDGRQTTVKTRIIASEKHVARLDEEQDTPADKSEEAHLLGKIEQLISECDLVIFEDYDKGAITPNLISSTIASANKKGIPTVVDPKKRNFMKYAGTTLFKPNLKELVEGVENKIDPSSIQGIEHGIDSLLSKMPVKSVMVTLSEQGVIIRNQEISHHIKAYPRNIVDVSGAGDTVVTIAGLALASKLSHQAIAILANLAGGLVCEHAGVVPVNKAELLQELKDNRLQLT